MRRGTWRAGLTAVALTSACAAGWVVAASGPSAPATLTLAPAPVRSARPIVLPKGCPVASAPYLCADLVLTKLFTDGGTLVGVTNNGNASADLVGNYASVAHSCTPSATTVAPATTLNCFIPAGDFTGETFHATFTNSASGNPASATIDVSG